jgi:hypothetical protein
MRLRYVELEQRKHFSFTLHILEPSIGRKNVRFRLCTLATSVAVLVFFGPISGMNFGGKLAKNGSQR